MSYRSNVSLDWSGCNLRYACVTVQQAPRAPQFTYGLLAEDGLSSMFRLSKSAVSWRGKYQGRALNTNMSFLRELGARRWDERQEY